MSTPDIYAAVVAAARKRFATPPKGEHLDIGAGRGDLIRELRGALGVRSSACDYRTDRMMVEGVVVSQVNLNEAPLPYGDGRFELVTCSEVVEHMENYRALLREAFRVAAPGAVVVITTPNVLSAASRARYAIAGFASLFGPLPIRNDKLYTTGGHITMIPYFFLAHGLLDAGFDDIELSIDKRQRTSMFWLALLAPLIFLARARFFSRERNRFKTITELNEKYVEAHFSTEMLLGRTIVVSAIKPV